MIRINTVIVLLFFINIVLLQNNFASVQLENNVDELTENLIENLRADPSLAGDFILSGASREFIDKHIENYMKLVLETQEQEFSRSKRSLPENGTSLQDFYVDLKTYKNITTSKLNDLVLFQQNSEWYAACLEFDSNQSRKLRIRKYKDDSFVITTETDVWDGVRIATFSLGTSTLIVVAENSTAFEDFEPHNIFEFSRREELDAVQKIRMAFATDVAIWEDEHSTFMSVAQFMEEGPQGKTFTVQTPIYEWRGTHFDIVQHVETSGCTRISPFAIGEIHFVALANSQSDEENQKIYSEILKYNVQTGKFETFQRILTYACRDMKYFKIDINNNNELEHFLIVANFDNEEQNGKIGLPSIIYKFVDNYFIPFQSIKLKGVTQWEPIQNDGNVLLIASALDGLHFFQYDGWQFIESKHISLNEPSNETKGLPKMIRSYKFEEKDVIVVVSEGGNETNMFEIQYSSRNKLKQQHDYLLNWCQENLKNIEAKDVLILGDMPRGDTIEGIDSASLTEISDSDNLTSSLQTYRLKLSGMEQDIENSLQTKKEHTMKRNITAKNIILNDDAVFSSVGFQTINNIALNSILENTLNINKGFSIDSKMEFDFLRTEEPAFPKKINGNPVDKLLRTSDNPTLPSLTVLGNANFTEGIAVANTINNITFNSESLLLLDGDQVFDNFTIENIDTQKLSTNNLNGKQLNLIGTENAEQSDSEPVEGPDLVKSLDKLKVKNLVVGGYINDMDLETLFKYALRKSDPQNITKTYFFDNLTVDNIDANYISDKRVATDLIPITGGNYTINKDVMFTNDLSAGNLVALELLNGIPVNEGGQLDILLKDSEAKQSVTGTKSFENLELLDAIKLQGKIRGKDFDTMNPIVRVDSKVEKDGDVRITGKVIVEEVIISGDIVTGNGEYSLLRVAKSGLKLNESVIPIRLAFSQHISVDELFADKINNVDPDTWVVNGAKQIQIVAGRKQFDGDLEISGDTRVSRINDIDMTELESNVLKKEGDQVIRGKHYVKFVAAEKRMNATNITFGLHPWQEVITTTGNQEITGNVVFKKNVTANHISVGHLKVDGLTNGLNFAEIINDAVTVDTPFKVFGTKTFRNITIDDLKVFDYFDFSHYLDNRNTLTLRKLNDLDNLSVENLYFGKTLNNMEMGSLITFDDDKNALLQIDGDQEIENITVYGNVIVESKRINHVDLEDFEFNTVKVDEPFRFDFVNFANDIIVSDTIALDGQIDNLDLDNIFRNTEDASEIIMDKKHFHENVQIDGDVHIDGKLNEVNASDLCGFASVGGDANTLVVEGNVHFAKGPHILRFNGQNVRNLEKNIWFNDREATVNGDIEFKKNVTFREDINLSGHLNDVDLHFLSQNYLSKTKAQNITGQINFEGGVLFKNDVTCPELIVEGTVNDINMTQFLNQILLHRPQLFEDQLFFEGIDAKSLAGNYLVNELNLESDVMRYDSPNTITGPKRFKNLDIGILRSGRNITVQDVDVNYWLTNAILNTAGTFSISGKKSFKNVTAADGLSLVGYFNDIKINKDTVLLKNIPQTIIGRKAFFPNLSEDEEVNFKALKIKGRVNDADIGELVSNQVHKTRDIVIKSPMNFHSNISATNMNFEKLYQGINVSELMTNITNLGTLSNFGNNYKTLLEMSTLVENSLKEQAYYLNYFKSIEYVPRVNEIFPSRCENGGNRIMTFTYENDSAIVHFLRWDEKQDMFIDTGDYSVSLGRYPAYIKQIEMAGKDYVFIENEVQKSSDTEEDNRDHTHVGELIHFDHYAKFQHTTFLTKGTHFVTSFRIDRLNSSCLLFIDYIFDMNILCLSVDEEFYIHQRIESEKAVTASVLNAGGYLYLVTVRKVRGEEPRTAIWKMNDKMEFEIHQKFYEGDPIDISTISCIHGEFVAVAYGHLPNTKEFGRVIIRRFDKDNNDFVVWQTIKLKTPVQLEFALLPTQELVLYITTENPTDPFNVYIYEGISGFSRKVGGSTIPNIINMNQFSLKNSHFIVMKHYYEIGVIRAVFKGSKSDF